MHYNSVSALNRKLYIILKYNAHGIAILQSHNPININLCCAITNSTFSNNMLAKSSQYGHLPEHSCKNEVIPKTHTRDYQSQKCNSLQFSRNSLTRRASAFELLCIV